MSETTKRFDPNRFQVIGRSRDINRLADRQRFWVSFWICLIAMALGISMTVALIWMLDI